MKEFKIVCLECGNEDIEIDEILDYDVEGKPYLFGYECYCSKCGNIKTISDEDEVLYGNFE